MSQSEIWTDRLLLRAAEMRDVPYFHKWLSDPESMSFWAHPCHATLADTERYLERMVSSPYNGVMEFTVCLVPDSDTRTAVPIGREQAADAGASDEEDFAVIGKVGLWDGKEMAYIFDKDHWRKGYAFEAIDAVLKHIWSLENAPEVAFADVDPRNDASIKLLLKLGFSETRRAQNTWKTHLGWRDSVYFEIRRPREV